MGLLSKTNAQYLAAAALNRKLNLVLSVRNAFAAVGVFCLTGYNRREAPFANTHTELLYVRFTLQTAIPYTMW
jgi:hypothetical protein